MQVRVVRPDELGDDQLQAWRAIQSRAGLDNPFLGPEFAQAVGRQRDDARVAVMEESGGPVGFFAFERRRLRVGKPIGAGLSDCQGVVAEPGLDWSAGELVRACDLVVWEFSHLMAGQAQFAPHHATVVPSPIVDLSGGFDAFAEAVSRLSRSWIPHTHRGIRRLERDLGPVRLEYDDSDPEAHRAVQLWKSTQYRRTGRPDPVARPWVAALIADLLAVESDTFRCVCSTLYAGDRAVAGQINLHSNRVISSWITAYDPAVARVGPGNVCDLLLFQEAAERGIRYVDLGKGDTHQKARIGTGELQVAEGWVEHSSIVSLTRRAARAPVRATRDLILRNPPVRAAVKRGLKIVGGLRG